MKRRILHTAGLSLAIAIAAGFGSVACLNKNRAPTPNSNDGPRQPAVGRWVLASVAVSPETPPQSGGVSWDYNAQSSSAQYALYNGDKASFQWTPPPQEIDNNGFTVSVSVQSHPVADGRMASIIGVSGSGVTTDASGDELSAYAKAENGVSASAQRSVTFKPTPAASEIEIKIGMQWAINFTYKYRRA